MKEIDNNNDPLASIGRELPFKVPDGYFENLPMRIQQQCTQASSSQQSKDVPLFRVLKSQLSLAAGFALMAMLAFAGYYYLRPADPMDTAHDDYIEIVQKNIYEYDMGKAKQSKIQMDNDSLKSNVRDEMFKYLHEENNDYVTLMEKY